MSWGPLVIIYSIYFTIFGFWAVLGVLGGWVMHQGPLPSPFDKPLEFLILTIPYVLVLGLICSSTLNFFSSRLAVALAVVPLVYTLLGAGMFLALMIRSSGPTDYLHIYYKDPTNYQIATAVFKHDEERTRALLSAGRSLEMYEESGLTLLGYASRYCDWETVEFLLRLGADPNTLVVPPNSDFFGSTPVSPMTALWESPSVNARPRRLETISTCIAKTSELLLKAGANTDVKAGNDELLEAVVLRSPSPETAQEYIKRATPYQLNLALYAISLDVRYQRFKWYFEVLVKAGADPDAPHPESKKSAHDLIKQQAQSGSKEAQEFLSHSKLSGSINGK